MLEKFLDKTDEFSFILAPSKIEGVGVFATHNIKNGAVLRLFPEEVRFFPKSKKNPLASLKQKFLNRWCVESKDGYFCTEDFGRMSVGWFLNHSDNPNSFSNEEDVYFAKRNIKKGEEITVDYTPFTYPPKPPKFNPKNKI